MSDTYQVMPPLAPEDFDALKRDIGERGVMVAVEYDEDGNILDGHHRVRACRELGIKDWPRITRRYADDAARRTQARRLNYARRHLDTAAKRALIADELRDRPQVSNRQIAADLGVDDKTVGTIREKLVSNAEIPQSSVVERKGGGTYPATKPSRPVVSAVSVPSFNLETQRRDAPNRTSFTGENEWYTPAECVELARAALGGIDTDPASSPKAQETVKALAFFTEADDGLSREWHGKVFLNPPYAQPAIGQFADKMITEWQSGRVVAAVMLTHNYTDTAWFQKLAATATAICFTRGRIRFVSPAGEVAAPTQGQAYFYFGDDVARFATAFAQAGFIVEVRRA